MNFSKLEKELYERMRKNMISPTLFLPFSHNMASRELPMTVPSGMFKVTFIVILPQDDVEIRNRLKKELGISLEDRSNDGCCTQQFSCSPELGKVPGADDWRLVGFISLKDRGVAGVAQVIKSTALSPTNSQSKWLGKTKNKYIK